VLEDTYDPIRHVLRPNWTIRSNDENGLSSRKPRRPHGYVQEQSKQEVGDEEQQNNG